MKKRVCLKSFYVAILIFVLSVTSLMANSSYTSSLSLDYRSTATGTYRSFIGTTHRISNSVSSRFYNTGDNYCRYDLQRQNGWSNTTTATTNVNLKNIGSTYQTTFYNQSSPGTYRYFFTNIYLSSHAYYAKVDGFTSNTVTLSSW